MYAFLVVMTIILPSKKHIIRIHDTALYDPQTCHAKAEEMAGLVSNYTRRRMPFAVIQTELGCSLLETRRA